MPSVSKLYVECTIFLNGCQPSDPWQLQFGYMFTVLSYLAEIYKKPPQIIRFFNILCDFLCQKTNDKISIFFHFELKKPYYYLFCNISCAPQHDVSAVFRATIYAAVGVYSPLGAIRFYLLFNLPPLYDKILSVKLHKFFTEN